MAEKHQIMEALEGLALHCRPPLMSVEDRGRFMIDWCEDLAGENIDAVRIACARWRGGTNPKFPLLGQFMPLVKAATIQGPREKLDDPWRPLTDAEYGGLSIRDKIRHHQILAAEADRKAGPQWKYGHPVPAEGMASEWRILKRTAENHHAEAKRLREVVAGFKDAAE